MGGLSQTIQFQAQQTGHPYNANQHHDTNFPYKKGDKVLLSTKHCRHVYDHPTTTRAAKFFPHFDSPYTITHANEKNSTVTLELPGHLGIFPVFHTSKLRPFHPNDNALFPLHTKQPPSPITIDGHPKHFIDKIIDEHKWHGRTQYLTHWQGEGLEGDLWLPASKLEACVALDCWLAQQAHPKLTITLPPATQTNRGGV